MKRMQASKKIKLSNRLRMTIVLVSIIIIAIGSGNCIKAFTQDKKTVTENRELYRYNNKLTANAKINLKSNDYIEESEMIEGQAYLSDLISNIDINFDYKYVDTIETNVVYDYKIEAIVKAKYSSTTNSYDVLNKSETIKEEGKKAVSSKDLNIKEDVNVDYEKYHKILKEFRQEMGINTDSYLYVRLTVNTITDVNEKSVENQYTYDYKISLGDKIAVIDAKTDDESTKTLVDESKVDTTVAIDVKEIIINAIIVLIGIALLRIILVKTEELRTIKNEFKLELHRIMKAYEDKIVEIEDLKNIDVKHATEVKDILQLRKLAEEALVPIYCYVKDDVNTQEAYFIVQKYESVYIYVLK